MLLPDNKGRLYSDTSKFSLRGALYQIQNDKQKLIAYANKLMYEAAKSIQSQS